MFNSPRFPARCTSDHFVPPSSPLPPRGPLIALIAQITSEWQQKLEIAQIAPFSCSSPGQLLDGKICRIIVLRHGTGAVLRQGAGEVLATLTISNNNPIPKEWASMRGQSLF